MEFLQARVASRLPKGQAEHVFRLLAKNYISFEEIERGLTKKELIFEVNLSEEEADALLLNDTDWPRRNVNWIEKVVSNLPSKFCNEMKEKVRFALCEALQNGSILNEEQLKNMGAEDLSKAKIPVAARVWLSEAYRASMGSSNCQMQQALKKEEQGDSCQSIPITANGSIFVKNEPLEDHLFPPPLKPVQSSVTSPPSQLCKGPFKADTFDEIPTCLKRRQKVVPIRHMTLNRHNMISCVKDSTANASVAERMGTNVFKFERASSNLEKREKSVADVNLKGSLVDDSDVSFGFDCNVLRAAGDSSFTINDSLERRSMDDASTHISVAQSVTSVTACSADAVGVRRFVPRIPMRSAGPSGTSIPVVTEDGHLGNDWSKANAAGRCIRKPGVELGMFSVPMPKGSTLLFDKCAAPLPALPSTQGRIRDAVFKFDEATAISASSPTVRPYTSVLDGTSG